MNEQSPPAAPLHERAESERARCGWSIEELARRAGIGRRTYERLATDLEPPILRTVSKLCQALDIDLAEGMRLASVTGPGGVEQGEDDPAPEEMAEFVALANFKRQALVRLVTLMANLGPGVDIDETMAVMDDIMPELTRPLLGMGPAALHRANMDVIMHLLRKLAAERGEPQAETWRREATELGGEEYWHG
ncbi:MAG TPA: helix-turn-helix transcriptional regulator [Sporichthya sp.]|nr:helix-turn-helix transcriptional regulator [Sporichthya sp.]